MTVTGIVDEGHGMRLSAALRARTQAVHDQAETAPYVRQLLAGALPLPAYTALVVQNHAIYTALEAAADGWRGHPVAGAFVFDELTRVPHLEADLAHLLGPSWRAEADRRRVPATDSYVARLESAAATEPAAFIAHHYVRYLGDLSGGQIIRTTIARVYGTDGYRSTGFYTFDRIEKIKPFRDHYRDLLDRAPLGPDGHDRAVEEAVIAFELNRAVFTDLAERHLPPAAALDRP
ncbi:heme oxygenase (biliverdin-producing) [Dactylosporangium sp. CA-092794]|uniref:biliverdin-producing heme oxygenase n=1 Tax=Dactylosporangium sp. CA-092794 TaxID=3239929 RepID=UPI003D8F1FC8